MNRGLTFLAIPAIAVFLSACGQKAVDDQALITDIQAKLYANDATRSANVKVAATGGVVTLSGDVPSADVELAAMKIANGASGVRSVNDQMKVAAADAIPPVAPEPAQNLSTPPPAPVRAASVRPPPPPDRPVPVPVMPPQQPIAQQSAPPPMPVEPPPPPRPRIVTIPAGERLSVRMIDGIDTGKNQEGQTFRASLDAPITFNDHVIVPAGAPVTVLLAAAKGAGRVKGRSELELRVVSLEYRGEHVPVSSSAYEAQGSARGKQTAIRTGIGAAAGALIGGLAGGGKGAGIGAAIGGGGGAGIQLATHGEQVKVPSETQITFRLEAPLTFQR